MKKGILLIAALFLGLGISFIMIGGSTQPSLKQNDPDIVTVGLPPEVLQYEEIVRKEAVARDIPDKVPVLLAIMAVESGGRGNDVMQSSESLGLPPNTLQPLESIRQGVKYYASLLQSALAKGCDEDVAIGGYNFGGGYIDFIAANGKKHTLALAERFSKEVVAPSLGNTTGRKYHYSNPIANDHGNYLYWNGGNFFYVALVNQYLSHSVTAIDLLERVLGQSIFNGECYGLSAYYVQSLGGPQMMGSGFLYAERIGHDYDWARYGWSVIFDPKLSDLRPGDVIQWRAGSPLAPGIYGHTGVIASVQANGQLMTYEQNSEKGRIVAKYTRTFIEKDVVSIVRKGN